MRSSNTHTQNFLANILPKVSRTFAINIRVLSAVEKKEISVSYLICRILDTIEDDPILADAIKIKALLQFPSLLQHKKNSEHSEKIEKITANNNNKNRIEIWLKPLKKNAAKPAEQELLNSTSFVVDIFYSLPLQQQQAILPSIKHMANGMAKVIKTHEKQKLKNLDSLDSLLNYCYYVAGTVGELLTFSYLTRHPMRTNVLSSSTQTILATLPTAATKIQNAANNKNNTTPHKLMLAHAINFGIGLQLTNILKDFNEDKKRNWLYIPKNLFQKERISAQQFLNKTYPKKNKRIQLLLLNEAKTRLESGIAYVQSIFPHAIRYRLFCMLPLTMAYATLALLKKQPIAKNMPYRHKIKKSQLFTIVFICYISSIHPLFSLWVLRWFQKKL